MTSTTKEGWVGGNFCYNAWEVRDPWSETADVKIRPHGLDWHKERAEIWLAGQNSTSDWCKRWIWPLDVTQECISCHKFPFFSG